MPINRTPITLKLANDDADVNDINNALAGVNESKEFAADLSSGNPQFGQGATSAGNRSLQWILSTSLATWIAVLWDNTASAFKLINQTGTLQKLSIADATASTEAVTKSQLDAESAARAADIASEAADRATDIATLTANQVYTDKFESGLIAINQGTTTTPAPHGLGVKPKSAEAFLKCNTAEYGYLVGEEVPFNYFYAYAVGSTLFSIGHVIHYNATNYWVSFASNSSQVYILPDMTLSPVVGPAAGMIDAHWDLIVRLKA